MTDKDLEIQTLRRHLKEANEKRYRAEEQNVYYRRQIDFLMETYQAVIRCKECKFMSIEPDGVRWCDHFTMCVEDDAFCSYAKRKRNG